MPFLILDEVRPTGEDPAVDTAFNLALEEGRMAVVRPPVALVTDQADRLPGLRAGRVQPQFSQQHQGFHGGGPALKNPWATTPVPIRFLEAEQPGAPAFDSDTRPPGGDNPFGPPWRGRSAR